MADPAAPSGAVADLVLEVGSTSLADALSGDMLPSVCAEAVEALHARGAAVLLRGEGGLELAGWSDDAAADLARHEAEQPEGPAVRALRQGATVLRAPGGPAPGAPGAPGAPRTALVAAPMRHGDDVVGCLEVFLLDERGATPEVVAGTEAVARVLGALTGNAEAYGRSTRMVAHLSEVLAARAPVEQAKGVLAERHRVGVGAALGMLRASARRRRTTVVQVAREVLAADPTRVADAPLGSQTPTSALSVHPDLQGHEPARPSIPRTAPSGTSVPSSTRRTGRVAPVDHAS